MAGRQTERLSEEYDDYAGHYFNVIEEIKAEKADRDPNGQEEDTVIDEDYELMAYSNTKIDYEYIIHLIQNIVTPDDEEEEITPEERQKKIDEVKQYVEELNKENVAERLKDADGIIVPGGFGDRGIAGMIDAIEYARTNKVPLLGICLGMQLITIEYARNICGIKDANSLEFDELCKNPVINLMSDQSLEDMGGTQRLGDYECQLNPGTHAYRLYGKEMIKERHRHRYEFNNNYKDVLVENGLKVAGFNPERNLVEIVELEDHPYYVGCQFHPEFTSRPNRAQPLFQGLISAAHDRKYNK